MVYFTVKVRNYRLDKLDVRGFIEDEDGAVVVKMGDSGVYTIPARGEKSFSFSYTLYGVANHTFKLFIDNTDGKPNGNGDEKWRKVKVEVKPIKGIGLKQVGVECDNLYFTWEFIDYHATLTCRAILYNPTNESLTIINSSKGKPWIGTFDSGISMSPSPFNDHLSKFDTDVSNTEIPPQGTTVITFKSEINGVPLVVLEYYWGVYYTITIPYNVRLSNGETPSFTLTGSGQITQNSYEVAADIGVNIFLFKGSGEGLKGVLLAKDMSKAGEAGKEAVGVFKEVLGWVLWWKH
ncbi:hypothetical protein [Palaeococcus sp. (in: euryarchaeotes)]